LGAPISLPTSSRIDAKLLGGAAIFGIGWGLAGICPGPGLVLLGHAAPGAAIFTVTLILGSKLAELTNKP